MIANSSDFLYNALPLLVPRWPSPWWILAEVPCAKVAHAKMAEPRSPSPLINYYHILSYTLYSTTINYVLPIRKFYHLILKTNISKTFDLILKQSTYIKLRLVYMYVY